ncbi:GNAT family N-acetyltransferase [Paramagnetospirillum kuznetsovii]|uniref:GNAT family N-acetyltransferase n=1 Tax=Paramagnetospirillum kuznetsovii TaxID=2053833 RepID=A0A364NYW6_9PROT|nr:GNAT family protein [Paramagnetospirillum kuznetsovii]RAU22274.1 GNAT family N-acetyltransferase [Paramagnetospirillum kuznetsovii]
MSDLTNRFGQPVGVPIPDWTTRPKPGRTTVQGQFCRLEPLDLARHTSQLYNAMVEDREGQTWTYLYYGPFKDEAEFQTWLGVAAASDDPQFYAVVDNVSGTALGMVGYLRIENTGGSISVGHIIFAPCLRRTPAATECMYLMLRRAFDELGYRRCEWRCDALNTSSRNAAQRFGFSLEGVFRQATVNKGRNRDTACFSIIDSEWPHIRDSFQRWLRPDNFDAEGRQRERLSVLNKG